MDNFSILLVEEDKSIADITIDRFSHIGYQLDFAPDYTCAMSLLNTKNYDLVITDLNLENNSGINLVREMRAIEQKSNRKPAYICGSADIILEKVFGPCFEAGMDALISRPIACHLIIQVLCDTQMKTIL